MSGPIVIMSALPQESALIEEGLVGGRSVEVRGHEFTVGTLADREVVLTLAGIGKVNAARVATLTIERFAPSVLLFSGVAGGLDETLRIGDMVIAERTIQHDAGVLGVDGLEVYQAGHVPFFNPTGILGYRPSEELMTRVRSAVDGIQLNPLPEGGSPQVVFGTVVTGDQYVAHESHRRRLRSLFDAQAVEMEGGAVAQVAEEEGVDHLVIRALSDLAGAEAAVDFTAFLEAVAANSALVINRVLSAL